MSDSVVSEAQDEPYKATITWEAEGIKITVEAEPKGLSDLTPYEKKVECNRRAKQIVDHFQFLIGKGAKVKEG